MVVATFYQKTGPYTYVGGREGNIAIDLARVKFADFNGDGITDIMREANGCRL